MKNVDEEKMDIKQETDNQILINDTLLTQKMDSISVLRKMSYNNSHFPNR